MAAPARVAPPEAAAPAPVRLFGTDGISGLAGVVLTPELALALGAALAAELAEELTAELAEGPQPASRRPAGPRPVVALGADPRPSSPYLEAAVTAGLSAGGADVLRLGVVPTPVVAWVLAQGSADAGVMISASHNPMPDNGLKVFGRGGFKLADAVEDHLADRISAGPGARPTGAAVGAVTARADVLASYADALLATLPAALTGLRVVVDCAHGAASAVAPEVYRRAGAEVVAIGTGDGVINDGVGATHLAALQAAVLAHGADVGIAHDGDADRCLAVAADGAVVDGDQILAILALTGGHPAVVTTVMANLAFHHAMRAAGIRVVTTPVGDRYVLEAMQREGIPLGGEQSGHVVLLDHATTGDGLLTALQLLGQVARSGRSLADLAAVVRPLPQVLLGCVVTDRAVAQDPAVLAAVAAAEAELGDAGRVLVRASGTEPLVRVMVEAGTPEHAHAVAARLAAVVDEVSAR